MFEDGNRTLTVTMIDESIIKVDNVPFDVTVASLLSRLLTIELLNNLDGDIHVKVGNKIYHNDDVIEEDEIALIILPKKTECFKAFFFFSVFVFCHCFPLYLYFYNAYAFFSSITTYVFLLFILGILCLLLKPKTNIFIELKQNILFDIIYLFLSSLSPRFRLENILLTENNRV